MRYSWFGPRRLTNDQWVTGDDGGHKLVVEFVMKGAAAAAAAAPGCIVGE